VAAGTVMWFNETSGYGFIAPDEGGDDLYVRGGNTEDPERVPLGSGDRVEFESRVAGMGPEAIGVRRLAPDPTLTRDQGEGSRSCTS
jgi:cold shock protein